MGIAQWPLDDRPRERLFSKGEDQLSDTELLAIILRTGHKGESAISLARRLIAKFGSLSALADAEPERYIGIKGLGRAKAAQLRAAIELGRRIAFSLRNIEGERISSPADVKDYLTGRFGYKKKEEFWVVFLNAGNYVLSVDKVESGTVNKAYPIVREIVKKAILKESVSVICAHNHPSGGLSPSDEDLRFTRQLRIALTSVDITLLDHLIISSGGFYSMAENGQI